MLYSAKLQDLVSITGAKILKKDDKRAYVMTKYSQTAAETGKEIRIYLHIAFYYPTFAIILQTTKAKRAKFCNLQQKQQRHFVKRNTNNETIQTYIGVHPAARP